MTRSLRLLAGRIGLRLQENNGDGAAASSFSSSLLLDNCFLTEEDVGLGQSFRTLQQVRFSREHNKLFNTVLPTLADNNWTTDHP